MSNADAANLRKLRFLGLPNVLRSPAVSVSSGSEYSASYADDNVLTVDPAQKWRSGSLMVKDTWLKWGYGVKVFQSGMSFDALGLVGHNLWDRTGDVRFLLGNGSEGVVGETYFEQVAPASSSTPVNVTGNHSNLGNLDTGSPTGIYATSIPSDWRINLEFASPVVGAPRPGSTVDNVFYQTIAIFAEIQGPGTGDLEPWESPSLSFEHIYIGLRTITPPSNAKSVTKRAGQWLYFSFVYGPELGGTLNSLMQGYANNAATHNVKVTRLRWLCESTQITGETDILHDTGWIPGGIGNAWPPVALSPYASTYHAQRRDLYHPCDEQTDDVLSVTVLFREDHAPYLDPMGEFMHTSVAQQFVEFGHGVGGIEFVPYYGRSNGAYLSYIDHGTKALSSGLGTYGQALGVRRAATLNMRTLAIEECNLIEERILYRGFLSPILVSVNPGPYTDGNADRSLGTIFATLRNSENTVEHRTADSGDYPRSMNLILEEFR